MTVIVSDTSIEILGKTYALKCAPEEVSAIQKAAQFLQDKIQVVRDTTHLLSADRITVLAALNIAHEFQAMEAEKNSERDHLHERLRHLQHKIEATLARFAQMELPSAE
jgi:cell division protein ZapA